MMELVRRLLGYVTLRLEGGRIERFFNLCAKHSLGFWNISPRREEGVTLCILQKNLEKAKEYAASSGCRLTVVRSVGAKHTLHQYRRRWVFALGALLCAGFLWWMSLLVWSVEITGGSSVDQQAVLEFLAQEGLRPGALLGSIDTDVLEEKTIRQFEILTHCAITREGTQVFVDLWDRVMPLEILPDDEPCNLVATEAGQILELRVREGDVMVKKGEGVEQGQLLVSGVQDLEGFGTRFLHSFGEVIAETYYHREATVPLEQTKMVRTGRCRVRYDVSIFGISLNFSKIGGIPYEKYDKISKIDVVRLGGKMLPITLRREELWETTQVSYTVTPEEAKEQAAQQVQDDFAKEKPDATVQQKEITYEEGPDGVTARAYFICNEDIAQQQRVYRAEDEE